MEIMPAEITDEAEILRWEAWKRCSDESYDVMYAKEQYIFLLREIIIIEYWYEIVGNYYQSKEVSRSGTFTRKSYSKNEMGELEETKTSGRIKKTERTTWKRKSNTAYEII